MKPYNQGSFDSLCGIYSLINADAIVNSIKSKDDSNRLFLEAKDFLVKKGIFEQIVSEGMSFAQLNSVVGEILGDKVTIAKPFVGKPTPALDVFWRNVRSFLEDSRRAVILGLSGVHDHWTVINKITAKQIQLSDSDGISLLNRAHCTTSKKITKQRLHRLHPAQTIFLTKHGL